MAFTPIPSRARRLIATAILTIAAASSQAAPPRLVLNAPNCAQEVENYRRECLRGCETSLIKPQCARSCNDPNKLSPRLAECEQRKKPTPTG
jgi:hypothetical protein